MGVLDDLDSAARASHKAPIATWDEVWATGKSWLDAFTGVSDYQAQEDVLDWTKEAQQTTWDREDTAVQRRAKDMEAAGINPLLAAGSAAQSSAPVRLEAPRWGDRNPIAAGLELGKAVNAIDQTAAQVALTRASARKTDAEADVLSGTKGYTIDNARLQNEYLGKTVDARIDAEGYRADQAFSQAALASAEASIKRALAGMGPVWDTGLSGKEREQAVNGADTSIAVRAEELRNQALNAGISLQGAQTAALAYQVMAAKLDAATLEKVGVSPKLADFLLSVGKSLLSVIPLF